MEKRVCDGYTNISPPWLSRNNGIFQTCRFRFNMAIPSAHLPTGFFSVRHTQASSSRNLRQPKSKAEEGNKQTHKLVGNPRKNKKPHTHHPERPSSGDCLVSLTCEEEEEKSMPTKARRRSIAPCIWAIVPGARHRAMPCRSLSLFPRKRLRWSGQGKRKRKQVGGMCVKI